MKISKVTDYAALMLGHHPPARETHLMAFRWSALVALDSFASSPTRTKNKNNNKKVVISVARPPLTKLSGSAHDKYSLVDRNYKYRQLFPTEEVSFHTSTQIFLYKRQCEKHTCI